MSTLSYINNFQYTTQVATLTSSKTIVGSANIGASDQQWQVVTEAGNLISIQNITTGLYASVASEFQGAPIVGSSAQYLWEQISVPAGEYQFGTQDGKFIWRLTSGSNGAAIVLQKTQPAYTGKDSQWGYNPVTIA